MSRCPACNGLTSISESCLHCGTLLEDLGSREDFYGPYRPYMSDILAGDICTHVLYCPTCGGSMNWPVPILE